MNPDTERICASWKTEREKHPIFGEHRTPEQVAAMWESSADNYSFERYSRIRDSVVEALLDKGLVQGAVVADIGCGPGTYAIPFAREAERVIAIDGSLKMLERLGGYAVDESLDNIERVHADCRDIPAGTRCDLAFSSLCPPMNFPEALLEMESISSVNAYVSSATIGGNIECEIWKELGRDYSYSGYHTNFAYEYLRSIGRDAEVTYFEQEFTVTDSVENTVASYTRLFSRYREITPELSGIICDVVTSHADGDVIHQNRGSRMGLLIWESN